MSNTSKKTLKRAYSRVFRELEGRPGAILVQLKGRTTITVAYRGPARTMKVLGGFQFRRHIVSMMTSDQLLFRIVDDQVPVGAVAAWGLFTF